MLVVMQANPPDSTMSNRLHVASLLFLYISMGSRGSITTAREKETLVKLRTVEPRRW